MHAAVHYADHGIRTRAEAYWLAALMIRLGFNAVISRPDHASNLREAKVELERTISEIEGQGNATT